MDTANLNNILKNVNELNFSDVWSGVSYETQSQDLNDIITILNKCVTDLNTFNHALILKEEYINTCNSISNLYQQIVNSDIETEKDQTKVNSCYQTINRLEGDRTKLRKEILNLLSKFEGINIEIAGPADIESQYIKKPSIPETLPITNENYDGVLLTPSRGINRNGPQACETWYDLNMDNVVSRMNTEYGIPIEAWIDPNTGIKMCKKVGEEKVYVMVAADTEAVWSGKDYNPESTYHMGDIVLTSWGEGMVVDYCGLAVAKRENGEGNHFDIAAAWDRSEYRALGQKYADEVNSKNAENQEQK